MVTPKFNRVSFCNVPVDSSQGLHGSFLRSNGLTCDKYKTFSASSIVTLSSGDDSFMYGAGNESVFVFENTSASEITVTYTTPYRRFFRVDCLFCDDGVLIGGVPFGIGFFGNDSSLVITLPANSKALIRFTCLLDVGMLTDLPFKYVPYV